jgi:hypothetical protein
MAVMSSRWPSKVRYSVTCPFTASQSSHTNTCAQGGPAAGPDAHAWCARRRRGAIAQGRPICGELGCRHGRTPCAPAHRARARSGGEHSAGRQCCGAPCRSSPPRTPRPRCACRPRHRARWPPPVARPLRGRDGEVRRTRAWGAWGRQLDTGTGGGGRGARRVLRPSPALRRLALRTVLVLPQQRAIVEVEHAHRAVVGGREHAALVGVEARTRHARVAVRPREAALAADTRPARGTAE